MNGADARTATAADRIQFVDEDHGRLLSGSRPGRHTLVFPRSMQAGEKPANAPGLIASSLHATCCGKHPGASIIHREAAKGRRWIMDLDDELRSWVTTLEQQHVE
jgi:hypothetical protein